MGGNESQRAITSSYAGETQSLFYVFDMAMMLKGLLAELTFGNMGAAIPTYVRNDKQDAVYQADSVNTTTNEKRLSGYLESNREELRQMNGWALGILLGILIRQVAWGGCLSSANLGDLLSRNSLRIGTEERKHEIRRKLPQGNTILFPTKLPRGKRIWTQTFGARLAWAGVDKWC